MKKAKSRLQPTTITTSQKKSSKVVKKYLHYLPLLGIGSLHWVFFALIVFTIDPRQIQNVGLPHLYLPIVLLFLSGSFFTLAFVLLHSRRAFILSLFLTSLFFFRLQHIALTWQLLCSSVIFFGILELSFSLIKNKNKALANPTQPSHANVKQ